MSFPLFCRTCCFLYFATLQLYLYPSVPEGDWIQAVLPPCAFSSSVCQGLTRCRFSSWLQWQPGSPKPLANAEMSERSSSESASSPFSKVQPVQHQYLSGLGQILVLTKLSGYSPALFSSLFVPGLWMANPAIFHPAWKTGFPVTAGTFTCFFWVFFFQVGS